MDIHIHIPSQIEVLSRLDGIEGVLRALTTQGKRIMADLTALTTEVARNTAVDESAITLLNGLATQLAAVATDPAAVLALAEQLRGSSDALAAAVVANTPAT